MDRENLSNQFGNSQSPCRPPLLFPSGKRHPNQIRPPHPSSTKPRTLFPRVAINSSKRSSVVVGWSDTVHQNQPTPQTDNNEKMKRAIDHDASISISHLERYFIWSSGNDSDPSAGLDREDTPEPATAGDSDRPFSPLLQAHQPSKLDTSIPDLSINMFFHVFTRGSPPKLHALSMFPNKQIHMTRHFNCLRDAPPRLLSWR